MHYWKFMSQMKRKIKCLGYFQVKIFENWKKMNKKNFSVKNLQRNKLEYGTRRNFLYQFLL